MTAQRKPLHSEAVLSAEDTYAPPLRVPGWSPNLGRRPFDLAISGTFQGTLALQLSYDEGATWLDTGDSYTTAGVHVCEVGTPCLIRCGFKSDAYSSGSANVRLAL